MRSAESWILSYLLNSFVQIPLLWIAGWAAARMARRTGAESEHRVWVSVALLETLLPGCSTLPWEWLRGRLMRGQVALTGGEGHVSVVMGAGRAWTALHPRPGLLAAIALLYCVATAYFAARFVWRWRAVRVLERQATDVALAGEAARLWKECAQKFGIDHVSVGVSEQVSGPVTMGFSRKLVLLPEGMLRRLPEAEMRAVIAHECAHVYRDDFRKNFFYEALGLPVSYHPLSWFARERLMESREVVCDQLAAEISGRREYTRSLLRLASFMLKNTRARTAHAIGIFDAHSLERRLMRLTEKTREEKGPRRLAAVAACCALAVAMSASALALRMHVDAAAAIGAGAGDPAPITVPAGEIASKRISGPMPKYPVEAKKAKIQGTVALDGIIGKDGSVKRLRVASGPQQLRQSSLDAVRQWKYEPYRLDGNPVEVETVINVIYSLQK